MISKKAISRPQTAEIPTFNSGQYATAVLVVTLLTVSLTYDSPILAIPCLIVVLFKHQLGDSFVLAVVLSVTMIADALFGSTLLPLAYFLPSLRFKKPCKDLWLLLLYVVGVVIWSLIWVSFNIESFRVDVRSVLWSGMVHSLVGPLILITVIFNYRGGPASIFLAFALAGLLVLSSELVASNINPEVLSNGAFSGLSWFILYALPMAILVRRKEILLISLLLLVVFLAGSQADPYISSALVAILVISVISAVIFKVGAIRIWSRSKSKPLIFLTALCLFLAAVFLSSYDRLVKMGLPASVSYKISQPLHVGRQVLTLDHQTIPVVDRLTPTLQVRYVAIINSLDRNILENFFGSGIFSFFEESKVSYFDISGRSYDDTTAYSPDQFSAGQFYRPHNTARGVLNYGFLFFLISGFLFMKQMKGCRKKNAPYYIFYLGSLFFVSSLWNPYFSTLALQLWLLIKTRSQEYVVD